MRPEYCAVALALKPASAAPAVPFKTSRRLIRLGAGAESRRFCFDALESDIGHPLLIFSESTASVFDLVLPSLSEVLPTLRYPEGCVCWTLGFLRGKLFRC